MTRLKEEEMHVSDHGLQMIDLAKTLKSVGVQKFREAYAMRDDQFNLIANEAAAMLWNEGNGAGAHELGDPIKAVHVKPQGYPTKLKYPDGNPKTQFGITKPRDTYTPPIPYLEYSLAHLQGALKYGPFNWRDDPVTMSTYLDAAISHINKFRAGLDRASDTNIHELGHAMTCLSIVIDAQAYGTIRDDRWKPRDPSAHPWGDNPGKVLDDYIENNQDRVKAIREKWTGFADRFKAGEVDKNGDPIKKEVL